ncbi:MAG: hypothetical protein NT120_04770 [Candidatus Aenigmarchaeota archaeon]|nr:hypothetical protein [Candidatus Aenigmarchaeota archaeon]
MADKSAGEWLYLVSVVIAVLAGLAAGTGWANMWVPVLLVILGIVVGLINITEKETSAFLVASIALIVAGGVGFSSLNTAIAPLGTIIDSIVKNIAIFVAPAAVIAAVKAVHALASKK